MSSEEIYIFKWMADKYLSFSNDAPQWGPAEQLSYSALQITFVRHSLLTHLSDAEFQFNWSVKNFVRAENVFREKLRFCASIIFYEELSPGCRILSEILRKFLAWKSQKKNIVVFVTPGTSHQIFRRGVTTARGKKYPSRPRVVNNESNYGGYQHPAWKLGRKWSQWMLAFKQAFQYVFTNLSKLYLFIFLQLSIHFQWKLLLVLHFRKRSD